MEALTRSLQPALTAAPHLLVRACCIALTPLPGLLCHITTKALVGNLPYSVGENDIDSFFSQCGGVDDIFLVKDRETGDPKVREERRRLKVKVKVKGSLLGRACLCCLLLVVGVGVGRAMYRMRLRTVCCCKLLVRITTLHTVGDVAAAVCSHLKRKDPWALTRKRVRGIRYSMFAVHPFLCRLCCWRCM